MVGLAVVTTGVHLVFWAVGPYELHRDALLYLAMGEHLQLLRMDAPPFIAVVSRVQRLLGDSMVVIHLGTALAHGALIVLAAAFARRAGGGTVSQLLAALVVATAPVYMRAGTLFQPVAFDQLWWAAALYALIRIPTVPDGAGEWGGPTRRGTTAAGDEPGPLDPGHAHGHGPAGLPTGVRSWMALGLFLGLGLLTKFTIVVLGVALLVGIAASPLRRWLATPWPWVAAVVAFLVGAPSIVGQVALDWPFLAQLADLEAAQLSRIGPADFTLEQLLLVGPAVLVAAGGTVAVLARPGRGVDPGIKAVAWTAAAAFAIMLLVGGKPYYIAPIWPALLGIGFAALEGWARSTAGIAVWGAVGLAVGGFAVVGLPMGLPLLPPEPMARYAGWLGVTQAVTTNTGEQLTLPQDYADMLGWETLADSVADVYRSLPPEDREQAVILATNYGRAGAVDFYAGEDIPDAVAPVGSYWFWGPGDRSGAVTIVVGAEPDDVLGEYFRDVTVAARVRNPWGVPEEHSVAILVARSPVRSLQEIWPSWRGVN